MDSGWKLAAVHCLAVASPEICTEYAYRIYRALISGGKKRFFSFGHWSNKGIKKRLLSADLWWYMQQRLWFITDTKNNLFISISFW